MRENDLRIEAANTLEKLYGKKSAPFELTDASYQRGSCSSAERILETAIRIPSNEFYTEEDIKDVVASIQKVAQYYSKP